MNGSYYSNPMFNEKRMPADTFGTDNSKTFPMEQSYVENILRANIGKKVSAYVSFPDSLNWKDKIFTGTIEQAGRDHLIIKDPNTGTWYLILMIYIDYFEFDEKINYSF